MASPDYQRFQRALARGTNQPQDALDALCSLARTTIGARLFTVMLHDPAARQSRRLYSNMPDAYPVSGTKPTNETDWARVVLRDKRIFVANDIATIAEVFPDHELIRSLGCESVINVPVVVGDQVIGTINCLHEAHFYTPDKVAASEALKLPGAVCLLLAAQDTQTGGQDD